MTGTKPFTMLAAVIFLLMAVAHAYRLATDFQIILGSHAIALSLSWIALAFSLLMSWMLFREARR